MRAREVTLATESLRVPFLAVDIFTLSADRGGRELGSARCVGVVEGRVATGDTQGLSTAVLGESATVSS